MTKVSNLIKKNQDFILYTFSFFIYTFVQQIILMPYLSRECTSTEYSLIIIFLTMFNILCYAIGDELANVKLIRAQFYRELKKDEENSDYNRILFVLFFVVLIFLIFFCKILKFNYITYIYILFTTILGIYRHFILSFFKLSQKYMYILILFVFYFIGSGLGIYINKIIDNYFVIFAIAEIVTFIYYMTLLLTKKIDFNIINIKKTKHFKDSLKTFIQLSMIALIFNLLSFIDRLIIYPILGSIAMNQYYVTTTMSKFASLIINPISNILLARLAISKENYVGTIKQFVNKYSILIIIVLSLICILVSFLGVKILYNQYLEECVKLFIPVGIAMAFSLYASILKPFLLKYYKTAKLLILNIIYMFVMLFSIILSYKFNVFGFSCGVAISKVFLLISYIFCLKKIKNEG